MTTEQIELHDRAFEHRPIPTWMPDATHPLMRMIADHERAEDLYVCLIEGR